MKGIIDRFEGEYAVVEIKGKMQNVRRSEIPDNASEGDIIYYQSNKWILNKKESQKTKESIDKLINDLWEK